MSDHDRFGGEGGMHPEGRSNDRGKSPESVLSSIAPRQAAIPHLATPLLPACE
jgi:hypothetical protein